MLSPFKTDEQMPPDKNFWEWGGTVIISYLKCPGVICLFFKLHFFYQMASDSCVHGVWQDR